MSAVFRTPNQLIDFQVVLEYVTGGAITDEGLSRVQIVVKVLELGLAGIVAFVGRAHPGVSILQLLQADDIGLLVSFLLWIVTSFQRNQFHVLGKFGLP